MTFTVTDFKTQLAAGAGGARPSLYTIDIDGPTGTSFGPNSNLLVKAAAIPASTIAPLTINYYGRAYKTPGFRTFDVWNVTVINDENMEARQNIIQWMRYLAGHLDGKRDSVYSGSSRALSSSEGTATVKQMGLDGSAKHTWKLNQCWPTELGEIPLDWSSDAIEEYTVGFAYDYWSHGAAVATGTQKSDYRLKDNIVLLQKATSILPNIYMFKYKWDKFSNYIGVMAQELLDTGYKNAVHKNSEGYYSVDYSRLGFPMMKISKSQI